MAEEQMVEDIVEDISTELKITEGEKYNETLLTVKVKGAYREVRECRAYLPSRTDEYIENDMWHYYSNVRNIAMYDYNHIGMEGMSQFSQDGVSYHSVDRDKLFAGVIPEARRGR